MRCFSLRYSNLCARANVKQALNFQRNFALIYFGQVVGIFIFIRLCRILKWTSAPGPPDVNKWIIGNDIHGLSVGRVDTHGPGRGYVNEHGRTWAVSIWCRADYASTPVHSLYGTRSAVLCLQMQMWRYLYDKPGTTTYGWLWQALCARW